MTEYLVRKFVKNPEAVHESKVRASYSLLAGGCGVFVNFVLFLLKFLIGQVTGAVSISADAFNNLSDVASSVISAVGAKIAGRPADDSHPFGHGRMEYLAAFAVSFLVLGVGFSLLKDSVGKILHPEPLEFSVVVILLLLASILCKLWLSRLNRELGTRIDSEPMKAAAADAAMDCLSTAATILSLVCYGVFHWNIDGIIGLLVSFLILKCGIEIASDTLKPLLGGSVDSSMDKELKSFFFSYPGVLGCHDLIVHNYGPGNSYATVHIEVSDTMSLNDAHILLDTIERECFQKYRIHLVTHTDPIDVTNPATIKARKEVEKAVTSFGDPKVSSHDVRVVPAASGRENVVFDLVVPYKYSREQTARVINEVRNKLKEENPTYDIVVTVEHSFAGGDEQ